MLGKLLVSSSVLSIYFVSLVAMHGSAMAPAMIASAHVTTEALMCFHDNTQSNAAMHDLNGVCYPLYRVASSMANTRSDAEELPHWLQNAESWTVEIVHWNSADMRLNLLFSWGKGENDIALDCVMKQIQKEFGGWSEDAVVVLNSPETHAVAKLDHSGCRRKVREFLHTCISDRHVGKKFSTRLQFSVELPADDEVCVSARGKVKHVRKTVCGMLSASNSVPNISFSQWLQKLRSCSSFC